MLRDIISSVQSVSSAVEEISNASKEQCSGITQVNGAISQMDEITIHNAALVEQTTAASITMKEHASQILNLMALLKQAKRSLN